MTTRSIFQNLLFFTVLFLQPSIFGQVDTVFFNDGKVQGIGTLINGQKNGKWTTYFDTGSIESEGHYKNNKRTGKWIWYHDNGVLCSKEKYKNNKLKIRKSKFWDKKGNPSNVSEIITDPKYPGGMNAFRRMVADNLKYPREAQLKGISGKVFVQFAINKKGELVDAKIIKGVDPYLDNEALRVVKLSGKWTPGTMHGKKLKVKFTFPVIFSLQ